MNGKLLLFQILEGQILSKIRLAAMMCNVQVQVVQPGQYHQTVGQIALLPPLEEAAGGIQLPEPMMVLCVQQDALDGVLAALRNAGVPPVCKAVLTPTNAAWTPVQLLTELQRERAEFLKMRP